MKRISLLLILIFIIGGVLAAVPDVSQINYDPNPAVPGSTISVLVQIENLDDSIKKDVFVNIEESYPFTVKETNKRNIGNLGANAKTITIFKIYIDPSAENSTYNLEVKVTEGEDGTGIIKQMPVVVSGSNPVLKIMDTSESKLIPGEEKEVFLTVQNIGTSTAYDISVEFQEDRVVTASGVVVERDITVLGSAIGFIEKLHATEQANVGIKLSVNRKADLKNYTLPVTITYRLPNGTRVSETSYIGFKIAGPVIMDAAIKENVNLIAGDNKELTIELFNKGAGKAEFTIIEVSTDFGSVDREKLFIGSLEPNDVDSFKTTITVDSDTQTKNGIIKLIINYQDSDAINKQQILELPVKVYSSADGAALTPFNPTGLIINLVILVIIGVVGFKLYKKFKK